MKSLVIFLVEHGETIDPLTKFIDDNQHKPGVEDYDLAVDLAPSDDILVLYNGETLRINRGYPV